MNNNIIKLVLLCFLFSSYNVKAIPVLQCSLKCSGKNCGKNIKDLEECVNTCPSAEYKACWESGLEALNRGGSAITVIDRSALIKQLKANIRSKAH